jgi:3-oxoacyl-[acyl-carrier-protein] synthase III
MTRAGTSLRLIPAAPGARILGWGSSQPDHIVTNDDLAKRVDTNDQWIRERVGIVSRRIADKDTLLVDMAADAGSKAIADAGLGPADVDTVLVATCTMPNPIPNAAAQVAHKIGVSAPGAFDLNAACAGFCYGMGMASDLIRAGSSRNVLVIGAEKLSDWLDWDDRSTSIIFADGAGAAVLGPAETAEDIGVGPLVWGSDGEMHEVIRIDQASSSIRQEGQTVFRWATTQIAPIALRAIELAGLTPADIDVFVPHQANLRIIESVARRLRKAGAREDMRVAQDIVHSGNTSSASIPLAIDHMRAAGEISRGDVVLLVGFGAGLSYAGQVVVCP